MLTRKQHELLTYIDEKLRETGISPSYDEMKDALRLRSKSGIHRLITGLVERGFIRRLPHRARALEVLKLPENMESKALVFPSQRKTGFSANVITGQFAMSGAKVEAEMGLLQLPIYGRIAAGTPIEALRDPSSTISVPATMLSSGEHYALEVEGDSMIEAGILNGDTVLILRSDSAENGAIVVALVEDQEVTLKRLRRKGDSIALEPANKSYETRIFGPDQVQVQGRLVGLIRSY